MESTTNNGLEKELKYHLRKSDYLKLLRACKKQKKRVYTHINYYFDDEKLRLRKNKFGLRIRIVDGETAIVTLKHPAKTATRGFAALKIRHEYEQEISLKVAKAILKGKKNLFDLDLMPVRVLKKAFSDSYLEKIIPLGGIKTVRTILPLKRRLELELDRCKMFDEKFYELEVETGTPKMTDRVIRSFLKKHSIPYTPLSKSKLGRFLDQWKKINH